MSEHMQTIDDTRAEQQKENARLLKAMRDAEVAATPKDDAQDFGNLEEKMARRHAANMVNVKMQDAGPLPLTTATLEFLPKGAAQQYERCYDGSFRLRYITDDDEHSFSAHQPLIASAKLQVVKHGETPESKKIAQAVAAAKSEAIIKVANERDAMEREAARLRAKAAAQRTLDAQFGTAR